MEGRPRRSSGRAADGVIGIGPDQFPTPEARSIAALNVQQGKTVLLPGQPDRFAQQAPEFLPDEKQFLVFVTSRAAARGVHVGARDGRAPRKLLDGDGSARYVERGTLFAQRVDGA